MTEPTYEQLRKSEDENRYEAGLYHSLYDLWEKRANEYQRIVIDLFKVLATIRDESTDPTVALLAREALEIATKEPETALSKQNEFNPERQYPGSYGALSNGDGK